MTRKMLINATEPEESRVAILHDGLLDQYHIERTSRGTCLGNIYLARVTNLEPSIDAAFVDFGGARHGFLHASDVIKGLKPEGTEQPKAGKKRRRRRPSKEGGEEGREGRSNGHAGIGELLSKGQELVVQVTKEGIGDKAPTLTTYISLPGRFLVFMPGTSKRGISRKIEDEEERERLKKLLEDLEAPEGMGLIVRTAGAEQTKREMQRDARYLNNLWKVIQKRSRALEAPALLYREDDLLIRALRDLYYPDIEEVWVDEEGVYHRAKDFMKIVMPRHAERVKLYQGGRPLFEKFNVEKELESLFNRRIPLPSGGSLVIEQTEALVAIDVNSGRFKGGELEETAYRINLEAAREIARQLRLRDVGGLIINDFIDMKQERHRREVEKTFRESLRSDRARIKLAKISAFGIIEMTRQRVRPSLKRSLFDPCPSCKGTGYVISPETMCLNIIRKIRSWIGGKRPVLRLRVHPVIADYVNNHKRSFLHDLEKKHNKRILVVGDPDVPLDKIRFSAENPEPLPVSILEEERAEKERKAEKRK